MIDLTNGWKLHIDPSAEWLFFRLTSDTPRAMGEPAVAEAIAREAAKSGIKRIVLELGDDVILYSFLVGQVVSLHKRMLLEKGMFRLCGLSSDNADVLRVLNLAERLPNFRNREAAVMGWAG